MNTTVCFLRTGTCVPNAGFSLHLNQEGIQQAQKASEELREHCFEMVLCSPLPYAKMTAEIVVEKQPLLSRENIILTSELINDPKTSDAQTRQNIRSLIERIRRRFSGKRILLVSHGRIGKIFCSEHVGDKDEVYLESWANIARGEYFCWECLK